MNGVIQAEQGLFLCAKRIPEQHQTEQQTSEYILCLNITAWTKESEASQLPKLGTRCS
jgi:hypothetical protein